MRTKRWPLLAANSSMTFGMAEMIAPRASASP